MPKTKLLCAVLLAGLLVGCKPSSPAPVEPPKPKQTAAAADCLTVVVAYGSEKKAWLDEQASLFKKSGAKTGAGRCVNVELKAMGSGEVSIGSCVDRAIG